MVAQEHNLSVYKDLGFFSLKALLTLNAGAIIVVLSFLGSVFESSRTDLSLALPLIRSSVVAFLLGLVFCFLSVVTNTIIAFISTADENQNTVDNATLAFYLLAPAIASFGFFTAGVLVAIEAIG